MWTPIQIQEGRISVGDDGGSCSLQPSAGPFGSGPELFQATKALTPRIRPETVPGRSGTARTERGPSE